MQEGCRRIESARSYILPQTGQRRCYLNRSVIHSKTMTLNTNVKITGTRIRIRRQTTHVLQQLPFLTTTVLLDEALDALAELDAAERGAGGGHFAGCLRAAGCDPPVGQPQCGQVFAGRKNPFPQSEHRTTSREI